MNGGTALTALIAAAAGALLYAAFSPVLRGVDYLAPHKNACADLNDYVEQMDQVPDIRYHRRDTVMGIHRPATIHAVDELYDRAHCEPQNTNTPGVSAFKKLNREVVPDDDSMVRPEPPIFRDYGATAPVATPTPRAYVSSRRHVVITDDGTLDAAPPAPPKPVDCGPKGINWGVPGCRY